MDLQSDCLIEVPALWLAKTKQNQNSAVKLHPHGQYWQNPCRGSKGLTIFGSHPLKKKTSDQICWYWATKITVQWEFPLLSVAAGHGAAGLWYYLKTIYKHTVQFILSLGKLKEFILERRLRAEIPKSLRQHQGGCVLLRWESDHLVCAKRSSQSQLGFHRGRGDNGLSTHWND